VASVRWNILLAAKTLLESAPVQAALRAAAGGRPVAVLVRKRFEHSRADERQPSVVLVSEKERPAERTYENGQHMLYAITVGFVQERSERPESAQVEADVREVIRLTLQTPRLVLSTPAEVNVPSVFEVDYEPDPPYGESTYAKSFDTSAQRFTYHSRDQMTSAA
jgi:hypothetical protein